MGSAASSSSAHSSYRRSLSVNSSKERPNNFVVFSYEPKLETSGTKRGKIKEGFPEHLLVQGTYFLVKDHFNDIDKLKTLETYGAPNFRRAYGSYPVYGMGQPSRDGLAQVVESLINNGHKEIVSYNLREEPVIFISHNHDYVPYSPRGPSQLRLGNISYAGVAPEELAETELNIREEILNFAATDEGKFYFYNDVEMFEDEPHKYEITFADDLCILDEIYSRQMFVTPCLKYHRIPITATNAPEEQDFDEFIDALKDIPNMFDRNSAEPMPAMVFNCHVGQGRTTAGMVIGCLIFAHKVGFPPEANTIPFPIDESNPDLTKGEFPLIIHLVKHLPDGHRIKHEVDAVIDVCSEVMNLRTSINFYKEKFIDATPDEDIQGENAKDYWLKKGLNALERYFFLIVFNAYLHEQFGVVFSMTFCKWMRQRPWLYRLLSHIELCDKTLYNSQILTKHHYLVGDENANLDVMMSNKEIGVSNFRKVQGFPIYGMAQPTKEGLKKLVDLLLNSKPQHPNLYSFNMREDIVVELDGKTFSPRKVTSLCQNIFYRGYYDTKGIERKEADLKEELIKSSNKSFEVYTDASKQRVSIEFEQISTLREMYEQVMVKTPNLYYFRIPIPEDCAPEEKEFDHFVTILDTIDEIYTDEDGPALIFNCHIGKGRTTTAMVISALIYCNKVGFPLGTKPEEQEHPCVPNAKYTLGEFAVIRQLQRIIPDGPQRKREVDYVLDRISETMTPMHYHTREIIFHTYNKYKNSTGTEEKSELRQLSLNYLERYFYLIIFNTYLHMERRGRWQRSFSQWMMEVAAVAGVYGILDNLGFHDFEKPEEHLKGLRWRWRDNWKKHM